MKKIDDAKRKKIAAARARVANKLSARPSGEVVFNADNKIFVSHTVENTPENLANFDNRIAHQILNFDKLSQHEWEVFLREYIVYSALQSGLNDFDLCFKTSFVGTPEKGRVETNFIMLTAEYLLPTSCIEEFVDMLDTIDHELTHIADEKSNIITYRKFDNEQGYLPRVFMPTNFEFLQNLLDFEDEKIVEGLSNGVYYFTEWEVHARAVAAMRLKRLAPILRDNARPAGFVEGLHQKKIATSFANCVNALCDTECKYADHLQQHLDKYWPVVQKEFAKVLPVLKGSVTSFDDTNSQKELILNFPLDMASLIAEPELSSQRAFDDLFSFLIRANCRNASPFYEIISAKQNVRSREMLSALYDHMSKYGPSSLYSFHNAMIQAGEFAAKEFGKVAINPQYLNREMALQHRKRANCEYIK